MKNNQQKMDEALITSCQEGCVDSARHVLTSPELDLHADIHAQDDRAFVNACAYGYIELVKYLLCSPELSEHSNIHAQHDLGLRYACAKNQEEVVNFLLYDMHLEVNPLNLLFVNDAPTRKVLSDRIQKRDLFFQLNENLQPFEKLPPGDIAPPAAKPKI